MFPLGDKVKALKIERDRALLERRKFEDAATENLRALEAERGDHARTRALLSDAQRELVDAQNRLIEERNAHAKASAEAQANAFVVGDLQKQLKAVLGHLDAVEAEINKDQHACDGDVLNPTMTHVLAANPDADPGQSAGVSSDEMISLRKLQSAFHEQLGQPEPTTVTAGPSQADAVEGGSAVLALRVAREQYLEAGAAALAELGAQNGLAQQVPVDPAQAEGARA